MARKIKQGRIQENTFGEIIPTIGERLLLWRRRKKWNQQKAAEYWGISVNTYKLIEYDKVDGKSFSVDKNRNLSAAERCLLYRRRSNIRQEDIAKELGICKYWMQKMERGIIDCTPLISYWEC